MESMSALVVYWDHFKVMVRITPGLRPGLIIETTLKNIQKTNTSTEIEILSPIQGYVAYLDKVEETELCVIVGPICDIDVESKYLVLSQNKEMKTKLYCKMNLEQVERMKEIADRYGIVILGIYLYFTVQLPTPPLTSKKIYKLHPIFKFSVPKNVIDDWLPRWSSFYAQYEGLPSTVPREVLDDYIEAFKSFNVGAYKASVTMSRRALQQALEDKGANPKNSLYNQINELGDRGLLDKATVSLAHGVRHFGNYGAHPQDDLLNDVTRDDAKLALDVLKRIILKLYQLNP